MGYSLLFTCEHAGNDIPEKYKFHFKKDIAVLKTHEGWDEGAKDVASYLSQTLNAKLFSCNTSRLLIETNRSLDNSELFSRISRSMSEQERQSLIKSYYLPYRQEVESEIAQLPKPVLHLSVHTFTPIFNNVERTVDIGLLFDPDRASELVFCEQFRNSLKASLPTFNIQYNKPYLGIDDGFTTYLRGIYKNKEYLGIEIEINQKFISDLKPIMSGLLSGLKHVLNI